MRWHQCHSGDIRTMLWATSLCGWTCVSNMSVNTSDHMDVEKMCVCSVYCVGYLFIYILFLIIIIIVINLSLFLCCHCDYCTIRFNARSFYHNSACWSLSLSFNLPCWNSQASSLTSLSLKNTRRVCAQNWSRLSTVYFLNVLWRCRANLEQITRPNDARQCS